MKRASLALVLALALAGGLFAQGPSVEANLLWPFIPGVGIYSAKATIPLWSSGELAGELTVGALYRPPIFRDTEGTFSELGANLGYRQYLWKGAHVELALWPSYGTLKGSVVDGKDYATPGMAIELYSGWRFDLPELAGLSFYVLPQVGVGLPPVIVDPWPIVGEDGGVFFIGSLIVGLRLP